MTKISLRRNSFFNKLFLKRSWKGRYLKNFFFVIMQRRPFRSKKFGNFFVGQKFFSFKKCVIKRAQFFFQSNLFLSMFYRRKLKISAAVRKKLFILVFYKFFNLIGITSTFKKLKVMPLVIIIC